ncbi:MAG: hypothetical protein NUW22_02465 [Acidobacteria bacterium]|nr:hypothetical protein [Acidobacteriota bacterium]
MARPLLLETIQQAGRDFQQMGKSIQAMLKSMDTAMKNPHRDLPPLVVSRRD